MLILVALYIAMTTENQINTTTNHEIIRIARLVFGLVLVGIMSSLTHTFYLDHRPVELIELARMHRSELETHSHSDIPVTQEVADPRHIRSLRRAHEY